MDMEYKLRELLEAKVEKALLKAEANAQPPLKALLPRVRAAQSSEEIIHLTSEATKLIGGNTMGDRWRALKALFK